MEIHSKRVYQMIITHRKSALSSDKTDKNEYLTVEEILPTGHSQIIQQAKFTYSTLGKVLEKRQKQLRHKEKNIER